MKVAIVQETLRRYRVPFFETLKARLNDDGIKLELFVGKAGESELLKRDTGELVWASRIMNHKIRLGSRSLVWQACLRDIRHADLVIVEQASRMLINYPLLAHRCVGGPRVAFWGHGRNLADHEASRIGEVVKGWISTRVDWWFAYNDFSARIVEQLGFPASRISSVMNTVDTRELITGRDRPSGALDEYGLHGRNMGVFVGSLYPAKRLDLLVAAAKRIRKAVPDFELVVIGAGIESDYISAVSDSYPWIRYVGAKRGVDLARIVAASKVMLVPAFVGLVVIDAFALRVPLITCANVAHGPEMHYIENGNNGLLVEPDESGDLVAPYADAVVRVLHDERLRKRLVEGCRLSAKRYTMENMVARFADGVQKALTA